MRSEGQIVVSPLSKDRHQVSVERVALHISVGCSQNAVGNLSDLGEVVDSEHLHANHLVVKS